MTSQHFTGIDSISKVSWPEKCEPTRKYHAIPVSSDIWFVIFILDSKQSKIPDICEMLCLPELGGDSEFLPCLFVMNAIQIELFESGSASKNTQKKVRQTVVILAKTVRILG